MRGFLRLALERYALVPVVAALLACPSAGGGTVRRDGPLPVQITSSEQSEFDAARGRLDAQDWAAAERAFAAFLARHPDSALAGEARFRRAVALNRLERWSEARAELRLFLEAEPTSPHVREASVQLALSEQKLGNRADAEQILRPVVGAPQGTETAPPPAGGGPGVEALRRAAARVSESRDEAASAELSRLLEGGVAAVDVVVLYEELSSDHPGYPLVASRLARLAYHLGDRARAKEAAERAVDKGGDSPAAERARQVLERLALHDQAKPSLVGVVLPLSGRFKSYGEAIQDGLSLAISKKDGVELLVRDSKGDPLEAAQAVESLVREGVVAIIGPVGTAEAAPAAVRAQELGVPMILLSRAEGVTAVGSWIFRNSLTNSAQGKALARYAQRVLGAKRAAVLAPDIASGEEMGFAFWDEWEGGGGEMRGWEVYPPDMTTFAPVIRKLVARQTIEDREDLRAEAQRIRHSGRNPYQIRRALEKLAAQQVPIIDFDVLLVPDYYRTVQQLAPALAVEDIITNACDEKELERIRKTTRREEIQTVTLLGGAGWNAPELVQRGGKYVQCAVFVDGFFVDSAREPTRRFVSEFVEQFQRRPGLLEAQAYDTGRIVREVVQRQRPETREAFRAALVGLRKFPGATGETTFAPDREADKPLFFLTVDRNGITEMDVSISPQGIAAPGPAQASKP